MTSITICAEPTSRGRVVRQQIEAGASKGYSDAVVHLCRGANREEFRVPSKNEQQKREEDVRKPLEELRRIPHHEIDPTTWPKGVRAISLSEANGLGIDKTGRLYWNGKPVEIVGSRLDLTWTQTLIAFAIAIFTFVTAVAMAVQAWTAYRDMACDVGWSVYPECTTQTDLSRSED